MENRVEKEDKFVLIFPRGGVVDKKIGEKYRNNV